MWQRSTRLAPPLTKKRQKFSRRRPPQKRSSLTRCALLGSSFRVERSRILRARSRGISLRLPRPDNFSRSTILCAPCVVIYPSIMPTTEGSHEKTLAALGVTDPAQLAALFAGIRARFDSESAEVHDEAAFKQLRDGWLGRKSGVLSGITDNWLKPATPDLKRAVGAGLNELRALVDAQIEARPAAIESGAEQSAAVKEKFDLSRPGLLGHIGSGRSIPLVRRETEDIFCSID